jgi:uncharacterized damage-inducible protein DinB
MESDGSETTIADPGSFLEKLSSGGRRTQDHGRRSNRGESKMRVSDLERLFDYNYWANRKLFGVVSQLRPDEFTRSVAGSYESIRNTVVHVMSAEWGWLDRCGGPPRGPKLNPENFPTVVSVLELWSSVETNMRAFLASLSDSDLAREIEFSLGGPSKSIALGDLLQHAVVHGVHHRGQVALLLRTLGHTPGNFDFVIFAEEKPREARRGSGVLELWGSGELPSLEPGGTLR